MPHRIAGPCGVAGCPGRATNHGRCATHKQAPARERYGPEHDALRKDYQARMNRGEFFTCWRCDETIDPEHWRLGHDDFDRSLYRGPECIPCNQATAGR